MQPQNLEFKYYGQLLLKKSSFFRYDLAELLLKLRQYDKAEKVLKTALGEEQSKSSFEHAYAIHCFFYGDTK